MYNGHILLALRLALSPGHFVRTPLPAHLQAGRYLPDLCPLCSFLSLSLIVYGSFQAIFHILILPPHE